MKIRGTASHIAEKYIQLARDSQGSGDPVAAENYYQHAEHYFRLIALANEQFRQQNPYYNNNQQPQQGQNATPAGAADDNFDDDGDDGQPYMGQNEPSYTPQPPQQQPQPYLPRDAQAFPPRDQQQNYNNNRPQQNFQQPAPAQGNDADVGGLPSFITGGGGQPQQINNNPQGGRRTATTRATARTASAIGGGGAIAAAAVIAPTVRISAITIRRARRRRCPMTAAMSRVSPNKTNAPSGSR